MGTRRGYSTLDAGVARAGCDASNARAPSAFGQCHSTGASARGTIRRMTLPLACLLAGMILPYVWGGVSSFHRQKQFGKADNRNPREQAAKLTGAGARAYAAQANAWEALAIFTPAVLLAHFAKPEASLAPTLAIVWLVARVLHGVAYVADIDKARSAVFAVAYFAAIGLYLVGAGVL